MNIHTQFTEKELQQIAHMKKLASFVFSVNSTNIRDIFLAGGCFASFVYGEPPKDFDMFLTTDDVKETVDMSVKSNYDVDRYVINTDRSYLGNEMIEKTVLDTKTKIQYIFTKFKTRREVIDHFDMLHTCVSYVPAEDKLYISKAALDAINQRKIIPNRKNKIEDWRIQKMMKRGWKVA